MKKAPTQKSKKVRFHISADPGSEVFVAGTFNGWDPTATQLKHHIVRGIYETTLTLDQGRHEYKFVINGMWCMDPNCPESTANDCGSQNNVIHV